MLKRESWPGLELCQPLTTPAALLSKGGTAALSRQPSASLSYLLSLLLKGGQRENCSLKKSASASKTLVIGVFLLGIASSRASALAPEASPPSCTSTLLLPMTLHLSTADALTQTTFPSTYLPGSFGSSADQFAPYPLPWRRRRFWSPRRLERYTCRA